MAILEIELAQDAQLRLEKEAAQADVTLHNWVRLRLLSATIWLNLCHRLPDRKTEHYRMPWIMRDHCLTI